MCTVPVRYGYLYRWDSARLFKIFTAFLRKGNLINDTTSKSCKYKKPYRFYYTEIGSDGGSGSDRIPEAGDPDPQSLSSQVPPRGLRRHRALQLPRHDPALDVPHRSDRDYLTRVKVPESIY